MIHKLLPLLAFAAASLIACGSGEPAATTSDAAPDAESASKPVNACALLTSSEVSQAVGNPVQDGAHDSGTTSCKWDTANPDQVSVLLLAYRAGSLPEQTLCAEVRKGNGEKIDGVGDASAWRYSTSSFFNSGDLEVCGAKGLVSVSLNGKRDEAHLKQAAVALARQALGRL